MRLIEYGLEAIPTVILTLVDTATGTVMTQQATTKTQARTEDAAHVLTVQQQRALLRLPDKRTRLGRRDAALLAILLGGGLRVGEAVRLRVQDVEHGPNGSLLLTVKTLKRRDGHRRCVALMPPFVTPLQRFLAKAAPRFWLFDGRSGEHLSVRAAQDAVPKYLHQFRPDLRVHDLRHVALTTLLRASGGDVWLGAHMAGHTDTRQIMRVYGHHLVKDSLRAAEYMAAALTTRTRRG